MEKSKCQVHLLPTDMKGIIPNNTICKTGDNLSFLENYGKDSITDHYFFKGGYCLRRDIFEGKPQHLYFTTDEKIKGGDWYIFSHPSSGAIGLYQAKSGAEQSIYYHKIVATTNPELWNIISHPRAFIELSIPKIPTSFIESYIKAYNEGKPISEVFIEAVDTGYKMNVDLQPFMSKDGCVIVVPVEERMYTREEMKNAWYGGFKTGYERFGILHSGYGFEPWRNKWFNKNYPE